MDGWEVGLTEQGIHPGVPYVAAKGTDWVGKSVAADRRVETRAGIDGVHRHVEVDRTGGGSLLLGAVAGSNWWFLRAQRQGGAAVLPNQPHFLLMFMPAYKLMNKGVDALRIC